MPHHRGLMVRQCSTQNRDLWCRATVLMLARGGANVVVNSLKRIAHPEKVAEVIVSLVTSASFVTGQTVEIDGGMCLA